MNRGFDPDSGVASLNPRQMNPLLNPVTSSPFTAFDPGMTPLNLPEEEGCVVDNGEEEDEEGFAELGSGHEEEEEDLYEDDEEEDEDDDGEVVEKQDDEEMGVVLQEINNVAHVEQYTIDEAECSSPHEDELMGNALEALPELHSPAHERYVPENTAEVEEAVMDAISKRTRAHYSLADMSLDQLETFLQESDEDDYFHNVDDEEEYRKFLAAVAQPEPAEVIRDDDEEDDDADFELEIEEALESDSEQNRKERDCSRRPETREQRRERMQNKERPLGFAKAPLRPLLPYHPIDMPQQPAPDRSSAVLEASYRQNVSSNFPAGSCCFTAQQLGQLHCLIHEHVQQLVQIFSLCILEPSRQQVAIDTHRMLMELVEKRDSSRSWRHGDPFPESCFRPPFARSSVEGFSSLDWSPSVTSPVHSVLDVAPLQLVKDFLDDIAVAVQECKKKHVQNGAFHSRSEKQPLFPLPNSDIVVQPRIQSRIKKTMAAILVENTKKQTIALVPKGIAAAAARFVPLFNPAFYPHKPPPPATANRLLFTDAEDELLAMGLMTFNTDWTAIQQRFLPTKTTHQIFVRQKNRSSARAPENSIKAVRRMKNSSLTLEERESIQEALRCFKYDWNKVWQHAVPHRDPALLPRQWRTALGTQKSYKSDEITKGKRRLQEASKRRMKALQRDAAEAQEEGEVTNSEDDGIEYDDAHIHEAFLSAQHTQSIQPMTAGTSGKLDDADYSPNKRHKSVQTVKLAPGLPSLNLPPHVRIISQASLRNASVQHSCASVQKTQVVHPLLLQPSYIQRPNPSYFPRHTPHFHPFFGVKQTEVSANYQSTQSFHPLLERPVQTSIRSNSLRNLQSDQEVAVEKTIGENKDKERSVEGKRDNDGHVEGRKDEEGFAGEKRDSDKVFVGKARENVRIVAEGRDNDGVVGETGDNDGISREMGDKNGEVGIVMEAEELSDSKDEGDGVQFECEEIGDSDSENKEEIEFEEEEIGSESEGERGCLGFKECRASFAMDVDQDFSRNDVEAAHVLTVIRRKAFDTNRP